MLRAVFLMAIAASAVANVPSAYPGYRFKSVLTRLGLPALYKPRYSLTGLSGILGQTGVTEDLFINRINKFAPTIRGIVLPMKKQYRGVLRDLLQLVVLRYYGSKDIISSKISLPLLFGRYIRKTSIPSPVRYNAKYVLKFLKGFKSYLISQSGLTGIDSGLKGIGSGLTGIGTGLKGIGSVLTGIGSGVLSTSPLISTLPVNTLTPNYPGYELLATLKSLSLPTLISPKQSLGGIVAYLKLVGMSKETFISRIQIYRSQILATVNKYTNKYSYTGVQLDLLQVAALRYYGIQKTSKYAVSFDFAIRQVITPLAGIDYSVKYVTKFLVRLGTILVTSPLSSGLNLLPILNAAGLPALSQPQLSLGGITAFLKISQISPATFITNVKLYQLKIKQLVLKYGAPYTGYKLDLVQLAALRYYGFPKTNPFAVSFGSALSQAFKVPIADTYSIAYARTFLTRFSQSLNTPSFPGFNMIGVFSRLGLPSFKQPRFCVGGLVNFLNTAGVSQDVFIGGISRNSGSILGLIRKYKSLYPGWRGDLLKLAALRYYGIPKNFAVPFNVAFRNALVPLESWKYSVGGISSFLTRFSQSLVTPSFPGVNMIGVFSRLGLPSFKQPRFCVGGLVNFLSTAGISQDVFIGGISRNSGSILGLIRKYKSLFPGWRGDLLKLAALRYYGIPKNFAVPFNVAFRRALVPSFGRSSRFSSIGQVPLGSWKYSVGGISSFLTRFSRSLLVPTGYPGYQLKSLLGDIGLPQLVMPYYSLPGLVSYLQGNKFSLATLTGRIRRFGPSIRAMVYRYKKLYPGIRSDLLQLCAIRFYSLPRYIRSRVDFGLSFRKYLSSQKLYLRKYDASFVSRFLNGFISYIRKYQMSTYSGLWW